MNTIYCPSCGNKNEFTLTRPNFCSKCGSSFQVAASVPKVAPQTIAPVSRKPAYRQNDEDDDDGNAPYTGIPNLKKLELEITIETPQYEKLGNVLGSNPSAHSAGMPNRKAKSLEDFRKAISTCVREESNE